jgi:endonuclease/exonuclease/phosphatase family metal-dependent hydrolase
MKTMKTFTLVTFNVEVFKNLYDYNYDSKTKKITSITNNKKKHTEFKKIVKGIDIVCIQESYISSKSNNQSNALNTIDRFSKKNLSCRSHKLTWPELVFLYGKSSYLANNIYVDKKINIKKHIKEQLSSKRCASVVTTEINNKNIMIASVHLSGGRFEDEKAIQNNKNEKLKEIKKIVALDPDIICGDFNSKIKTPNVKKAVDAYFLTLIPKGSTTKEIKVFKNNFENWIYIDEIHSYLFECGYRLIYAINKDNKAIQDNILSTITDTSAFGGIVDYIYYKDTTLSLIEKSVKIIEKNKIMKKTKNIYTPILSDHFPVKAEFSVN